MAYCMVSTKIREDAEEHFIGDSRQSRRGPASSSAEPDAGLDRLFRPAPRCIWNDGQTPLELKARRDASRIEAEQEHPEWAYRQELYRSYAARAQICALAAGDKESTAECQPRYSRMLSKMCEALQLPEHGTEHVSTHGIHGVMSTKEVRQLPGALTSSTERSGIERSLTRRPTNQLMHISPRREKENVNSQAPNEPLEINPACTNPTR
eukprot:6214358-Pleurochrysis_carterae.AAC.7